MPERPLTTTRQLMCKLTKKELDTYRDELAETVEEKKNVAAEKKDVAKSYKTKIEGIEKRQGVLSTAISTKQEERDVTCNIEWDWEHGLKRITRPDTGEQVEALPLSDKERQEVMELDQLMK